MLNAITLHNISLDFPIYNLSCRSLKKWVLNSLSPGGKFLKSQHNGISVRALDHVSLRIEHGDRVGLIGPNGAGKSTFLRVLSNIYEPTQGTMDIVGKVSPLLDISIGINPESTGHENIYMQGRLLGLSKKEIDAKYQEIVEFSELGDFLSVPIHTYSAGMRLRLAFSVATSIAPEILVLDEVIGVGDPIFLKKAQQRLNNLIEQSSIVILASHSEEILRKICNKVIFLRAGQLEYFGPIQEGMELYYSS